VALKLDGHGFLDGDGETVFFWKAATLWKLAETMPVEEVALNSFDWTNENFQCGSLSKPPLWRDIGNHTKRILAADLQYPIIINAKGDVMDGMHRILKCYVFGLPTVKAVRFAVTPPPDQTFPASELEGELD
jgi:hypothetical protein